MKKGLILFAGVGGFRQGVKDFPDWEWTAVELDPAIAEIYADNYPADTVIVGDAMEYLRDHAHEFDFIQSSPPCQTHSRLRYGPGVCAKDPQKRLRHEFCDPMLWQNIIFLATHPHLKSGCKWLVENVDPYYTDFVRFAPQYQIRLGRHMAWSNAALWGLDCNKSFDLPSLDTTSKLGRVRTMSLGALNGTLWFDITKYPKVKNKRQVLRNIFEPELARYVFEFINSETN